MSDKSYYHNYIRKAVPSRTDPCFEETQLRADVGNSAYVRQVNNYNRPILKKPN
jgi:hypothetical protein